MTETLIAELQSLSAELKKKMEAQQDFITRAEVEKITNALAEKLTPQKSNFSLPVDSIEGIMERFENFKNKPYAYTKAEPWTSEYGKNFGDMAKFILAVQKKDQTLMSEGTSANGGYLVPTEFNNEVFKLMQNESIGRRIARLFPMSTWKRTFPKQLTNVSISWVSEASSKSVTKPTFGQVSQEAKVMAAVLMLTDELLRDSAINLQTFLAELIAEAMAQEEDRVLFMGNTGAGDPFMGVRYATGVVANTMTGATLIYDDLVNLETSISAGYRKNAIYVLPTNALKVIMKLKDNTGRPLWNAPVQGAPATINGYRYEVSDMITAIDSKYPILFGDFGRNALISPRQGLQVKVSQDAYDPTSQVSAFMSDQTWLRFVQAEAITIAMPAAFAYLDVK